MGVKVLKSGVLTTVQDFGRRENLAVGVSQGGVMDRVAYCLANTLLGNTAHAAVLEVAYHGLHLQFTAPTLIAVTGAGARLSWKDKVLNYNCLYAVSEGVELAFLPAASGVFSYLAVAGGVNVPLVLNSRSTALRTGFGGYKGRSLVATDSLDLGAMTAFQEQVLAAYRPTASAQVAQTPIWIRPQPVHHLKVAKPIRVLKGLEFQWFSKKTQADWIKQTWRVLPSSDRMGYRLDGEKLDLDVKTSLWSAAVTQGTVQVPPSGQPIVLLADSQTTGGYPRIAQVAKVDLGRVAQHRAGQNLCFAWIDLNTATQALYREHQGIQALRREIRRRLLDDIRFCI